MCSTKSPLLHTPHRRPLETPMDAHKGNYFYKSILIKLLEIGNRKCLWSRGDLCIDEWMQSVKEAYFFLKDTVGIKECLLSDRNLYIDPVSRLGHKWASMRSQTSVPARLGGLQSTRGIWTPCVYGWGGRPHEAPFLATVQLCSLPITANPCPIISGLLIGLIHPKASRCLNKCVQSFPLWSGDSVLAKCGL